MKQINFRNIILLSGLVFFNACDKKNDGLVKPITGDNFPQVIVLSDEGDGELEDEDKFSFKISLSDRRDPTGEELGGKVIPLSSDVTVSFAIKDFEGFDKLEDYILGAEAFYEIDDCTTSQDQGEDLDLQFDPVTGLGTVTFPAGVEEIEIEFETESSLFDDSDFNEDARGIKIQLTGISGNSNNVTVNTSAEFEYTVQDDEGIYGKWELDVSDPIAFEKFKDLFGLINEDIRNLDAADVEEINIEFEYGEVKAVVVLKETEIIDDCGTPSEENIVIEIEAEIEELNDDALAGDVEFGEVLELDNGRFAEFAFKGSFAIVGNKLDLTLAGELGDDETDDITLQLEK